MWAALKQDFKQAVASTSQRMSAIGKGLERQLSKHTDKVRTKRQQWSQASKDAVARMGLKHKVCVCVVCMCECVHASALLQASQLADRTARTIANVWVVHLQDMAALYEEHQLREYKFQHVDFTKFRDESILNKIMFVITVCQAQ